MKQLLAVLALFTLIAATPEDALTGLERDGYYIEPGSSASEQVVSAAVFDGRADGGRLYIVILAEEPSGGATTFSDSMLDLLGGAGYVVTVAPETVGFAGDGTFWTAEEMNSAIDLSLSGGSDDSVVQIFIESLTGQAGGDGDQPESDSGGLPWGWILLIGGAAVVVWVVMGNRRQNQRAADRLEEVKRIAKGKLDEVANDILELESEVTLSENQEVKDHYQRASATYSQATEDTEKATTLSAMLAVSEQLDLAIWELDCAEALLDGKPKPDKPKPMSAEPVVPPPPPGQGIPSPGQGTVPPPPDFDRRPERHSSGSNDLLTVLMSMMAMGGMRGPGGFGGPMGGWGGGGGGGGRIRGGGGRFGGGRIRGGGRRG